MNADEFNRITANIYESALNPDCWESTLNDLSETFGFPQLHLLLRSMEFDQKYIGLIPRMDPDLDDEYFNVYAPYDVRIPRVLDMQPGIPFLDKQIVSEAEMRTSPVFQEFHKKCKAHNMMGANLSVGNTFGYFAVTADEFEKDYTGIQLAAFSDFIPHIWRALRTYKANVDANISRAQNFSPLNILNNSVVLIKGGKICESNSAFRELTSEGFFYVSSERIRCADQTFDTALLELMVGIDPTAEIFVCNYKNRKSYVVRSHDPEPTIFGKRVIGSGSLILSITELKTVENPPLFMVERFGRLYQLSQVESIVLHAVLTGLPLSTLASQRKVKIDTVHKQLKSAMRKIDVSSQKEIFRIFERYMYLA